MSAARFSGAGACPRRRQRMGVVALVALTLAVPVRADDVIRAQARPEIPWVTAVLAPASALTVEDTKRVAASTLALSDVGVRVRVDNVDGYDVVVVEGPPEHHDAVTKAARAAVPAGGVLFVDGRTALVNKGALPSRGATSRPRPSAAPGQPLAPSPGLVDVEGAALALFVGGSIQRGALVVDKPDRAALEALVSAPLPARQVEDLRTRARAVVAQRRARAGGWARDMALMWLAYGSLDVEEPVDLGSALRARVFPAVLAR